MHINRGNYKTAYNSILRSARDVSASISVIILCTPNADSLFACRMLVSLLNADYISYRVMPVAGWRDLRQVADDVIRDNDNLRSLVLLDLGALIDLSEFFDLPPQATVHVIDSHRPYNLSNLFSVFYRDDRDQVVVWDDGDISELQAEKQAWQALQFEPESDSDSDSDASSNSDYSGMLGRRRRGPVYGSDEDSDAESSEKRKQQRLNGDRRQSKLSKREKNEHRRKIQRYYASGTFHGQSVAGQIYMLATELDRTTNDLLWLAILGLTYQFLSNMIDRDRYDSEVSAYSSEVERLNVVADADAKATSANDRGIRISEELRFTLFRHWNLYDAMFHSGYLAGKLKLWRDQGRKRLQGFLAKMGFSLAQCQQTYAHMDTDLKRSLRGKVDSVAPEFGLYDIAYPSFLRADGFQTMLSASDYVEGVCAILEVAHGAHGLDFGIEAPEVLKGLEAAGIRRWNDDSDIRKPLSNNPNGINGDAVPSRREPTREEQDDVELLNDAYENRQREWWLRNYWNAWDALGHSTKMLRAGLPLAQALHRAVIRQGTSMVDKHAIKTLRTFRLAVIHEGPDLSLYTHPATLSRLAFWLIDAVREIFESSNGAKPKQLPFVVASLDEQKGTYLVIGATGAADYGDVKKNRFGLAFREAAQGTVIRTRHERFDASIVEVRKGDLVDFIEKIHLNLR